MRRALCAAALLIVCSQGSGCGGGEEPVRLAVQVDCQGPFESAADPELSGAFLPLLQRGARRAAAELQSGLENAHIAGRPIEVKVSCTETAESTYSVPQLRTLLEEWHPDVVIGSGVASQDGFVVRDLAEHYQDVTFLEAVPTAQGITLSHPVPNVFRFALDNPQRAAGLGSYAYNRLGWRRAVVVTGSSPDDLETGAGFAAEFCSLGGEVTTDDGGAWAAPAAAAAKYVRTMDGVAVLSAFAAPTTFLHAVATSPGGAAGRLVLGGWAFEEPSIVGDPGASLEGAIVATIAPRGGKGGRRWETYLEAYGNAYPDLPPRSAGWGVVISYRNAVEAVAEALTKTGGDLGPGGERLRSVLSRMTAGTLPRPMRLDKNRQAVSSVFLARIGKGKGGATTAHTVRIINGVEQMFGGIFAPGRGAISSPSDACHPDATPPSWAS